MFYNKETFADLDLEVPADRAAFEAVIVALREVGFDMPIGLGGADKWPISHWQSMLFCRFASPDGIENVMFAAGKWDEAPSLPPCRRW